MKKTLGTCLIGLAVALGAGAQSVPPGLIDNLHIVGIEKWEVVTTNYMYLSTYPNGGRKVLQYAVEHSGLPLSETPASTAAYYVINMTVIIENTGESGVLLKDPQFLVKVLQPKTEAEVLGNLSHTNRLFKGTTEPQKEKVNEVGYARLVAPDRDSAVWKPVANIPGVKSAKETQLQFEVVVGATAYSKSANEIFDAFNAMNNQTRPWVLLLDGTARVGWQSNTKGESSAQVYSTEETEITLQSKPNLPEHVSFFK